LSSLARGHVFQASLLNIIPIPKIYIYKNSAGLLIANTLPWYLIEKFG